MFCKINYFHFESPVALGFQNDHYDPHRYQAESFFS